MKNKVFEMSQFSLESGAQLLARLSSSCRPELSNLDSTIFPNNGPFSKEIVEIAGDVGLGKTTLLMHIMARVILPLDYGGKDGMILLLMTEHNFDFHKFVCVLEKYICQCDKPLEASETDVLTTSLQNITVQRCFDETQFELAILKLHRMLPESNRYCMVALDSIGAFYYTSHGSNGHGKMSQTFYMKNVLRNLKFVVEDYNLSLVYTKPSYFVEKSTLDTMPKVNYFVELIDKNANETENADFVYKVDIPRINQIMSRKYVFDVNGCIEWKK